MFSLKILLNTELFGIWKAIIIPSLENFLFNFKLKMHKKNKTFDSLAVGSRVRYYMRGVSIPILISTVTSWLTSFVDNIKFSSVQSLSHAWLFAAPWTAAHQASQSITNSRSLLKLMSIESVMPSNHLILCSSFSSCLQSFPASGSFPMSRFFLSGGQSIGVSASASVLPMNIQDWFPNQPILIHNCILI